MPFAEIGYCVATFQFSTCKIVFIVWCKSLGKIQKCNNFWLFKCHIELCMLFLLTVDSWEWAAYVVKCKYRGMQKYMSWGYIDSTCMQNRSFYWILCSIDFCCYGKMATIVTENLQFLCISEVLLLPSKANYNWKR